VYLSAAAAGDAVFFVDGKGGDAGRFLRCLDPNSGVERWRRAIDKEATGEFAISLRHLLIADKARGIACLDIQDPSKEKELWKQDIGGVLGPPCFFDNDGMAVVSVESPAKVVALEAASGNKRWEQSLPAPPATGPVVAGRQVWIGDAKGLAGYTLAGGDPTIISCGALRGPLAIQGEHIACMTHDGDLLLVDLPSRKARSLGKVPGGIPPILTDSEVLYLTKGCIQRYDIRTGRTAVWAKIDAVLLGDVLTPMIVADSHVVFATSELGLVCMKAMK
jgi:hypothetical protein